MITDPRCKFLSPKQITVFKIAKNRGYVLKKEVMHLYDGVQNGSRCIRKLIERHILTQRDMVGNIYDFVPISEFIGDSKQKSLIGYEDYI